MSIHDECPCQIGITREQCEHHRAESASCDSVVRGFLLPLAVDGFSARIVSCVTTTCAPPMWPISAPVSGEVRDSRATRIRYAIGPVAEKDS